MPRPLRLAGAGLVAGPGSVSSTARPGRPTAYPGRAAWWVLADVCRVLEIGNPSDVARRLDDDEKDTIDSVEGGKINGLGTVGAMPTIINESGLYSLILTSRKPEAARRATNTLDHPSQRARGANRSPATENHSQAASGFRSPVAACERWSGRRL